MVTFAYAGLAIMVGVGFAIQVSLISAMSRLRGPLEATLLSLVGTIAGFTLLIGVRAAFGTALHLPSPFDRAILYVVVAGFSLLCLGLLLKGIAPHFAITGLFAIPLLVGAGFFGPRIGVGLYISAVIAGQLIGSVALDHFGAFGITAHRLDGMRVAGIGTLLLGVALIRGIKT